MSWCGGGLIRPTPGVECRVLAIHGYTLWPGQLAALAGLGALRHLDLQVVGVDEVLAVTPKRPDATCLIAERRRSPFGVAHVAVGVLAALAGVRLAADAVHRDGQRLVGLLRDRAVGHRAGREALDDLADRLDLVDRDRRPRSPSRNVNRPRSVASRCDWSSTRLRVLLEDVVALGAGGVLQLEHRLRVEQVVLALAAPLVLAAELERRGGRARRGGRVGASRGGGDLVGELVEADAAEPAHGAGEVLVDELVAEADRLEDLRAACSDATVEMPIFDITLSTPLPRP